MRIVLAAIGISIICALLPLSSHAEGVDSSAVRAAQSAIAEFKKADKGLEKFFAESHGYAVFPTVGKGGIGIGGAYGAGVVFVGGEPAARSELKQVTVGLQLGGQSYREVLFFESKDAFTGFQQGELKLSAQASAVAATEGVSANLKYNGGIAIVTMAKGGLMYEASVGGQHFSYEPYRPAGAKEEPKERPEPGSRADSTQARE